MANSRFVFLLAYLTFGLHTSAYGLKERRRRTHPSLDTEDDIDKYLRANGKDVAIWRCKNQVQVRWMAKVVPYVDIECEVLGNIRSVEWFHNRKVVETGPGSHTAISAKPHLKNGRYFLRWLDYKLRIYRATDEDSGVYTLRVFGPHDVIGEEQRVHAEIVTEYQLKTPPAETRPEPASLLTGTNAIGGKKSEERDKVTRTTSQRQRQRRLKKKTRRDRGIRVAL